MMWTLSHLPCPSLPPRRVKLHMFNIINRLANKYYKIKLIILIKFDIFLKRYNINIRDHNQPMLISRPTEKNIRGGQNEFIMLIPEISRATGMTDEMRQNFRYKYIKNCF